MTATRALPRHSTGYRGSVTDLPSRKQKWAKKRRDVWDSTRGFVRVVVRPQIRHIGEHTYTIAAMVCADWAAWLWGARPGLITAAVLLVLFEMKVGS